MRVEIKTLAKRLTKTASAALERAAKDAAEKGNPEVTIDHVVLQILAVQDEDAHLLLEAAGSSRADARKDTMVRLSRLKSGGTGRPGFHKALWPWIEGGWLLASTELAQHRARSAALLWAAARHGEALGHAAGPLAALGKLDGAAVRAAVATSPESTEAFDLDELEKMAVAARKEEADRARGEIEREREEEAKAVAEARAQTDAEAAAQEAAQAEAAARAAAAEAARMAWSAAEAAAAARERAAEAAARLAAAEGGDDDEEE
ncbi:MAG: hypothetical protein H6719_24295 [Sandaracinaceae bacterium]|nr:hypothetical protein [Sandaracinaceae bacterium]